MARISTYQRDTVVTKNDKVIGTDSSGLVTKNFKLEDIAGFFSNTNAIGIVGQINFKFVTVNRTTQTISFDGLGGNNTTFDNVTEVVVSELDFDGNNIGNLIDRFDGQKIILVRLDDYSNFGIFDITDVSDHSETNFKTITLTNTVNNGSFIEDKYYGIGLFPTASDKHYSHNQSAASATWSINHGLNKFPSVTVVLSTGQKGHGDVTYTDANNLTITFTGAESGKAYMN